MTNHDDINFDDGGSGNKAGLWDEILTGLKISDLLALRAQIDKKLPATDLSELNLEKETVIHFMTVKEVMNNVMDEDGVPANQKAQLMNSCSSSIAQMAKIQTELYNAERVKKIEQAVIETLKKMDEDVIERFFSLYEELLEKTSDGS